MLETLHMITFWRGGRYEGKPSPDFFEKTTISGLTYKDTAKLCQLLESDGFTVSVYELKVPERITTPQIEETP